MLTRPQEYERMAQVEHELWWYRALHPLVLDTVRADCADQTLTILDAGCGTGGLLQYLQAQGYSHLQGFDVSEHAVAICRQRGLPVERDTLLNLDRHYAPASLDVVISNDTLYFLQPQEQVAFIHACFRVLRAGGLVRLNLPALRAFRGMHDLSVAIERRFSKAAARRLFVDTSFQIEREIYWPFCLAPLIYAMRVKQRLHMRLVPNLTIRSDIDIPPRWLNMLCLHVTLAENRWLRAKPFASSLFLAARKPI